MISCGRFVIYLLCIFAYMYSGSNTSGADMEEWRFGHIFYQANNAEIISFEGQVDIQRAGTTEWSPAELKAKLVVGDKIRTLKSSLATLRSADRSDFNVEELTQLTVWPARSPVRSAVARRLALYAAQKAEIISFEGQVDILRAGTTEWSPVELKTKLVVGDMIRTSKSSLATLRSADGPDFNVEELTRLMVLAPRHVSAQNEKDPDPPPASDRWRIP